MASFCLHVVDSYTEFGDCLLSTIWLLSISGYFVGCRASAAWLVLFVIVFADRLPYAASISANYLVAWSPAAPHCARLTAGWRASTALDEAASRWTCTAAEFGRGALSWHRTVFLAAILLLLPLGAKATDIFSSVCLSSWGRTSYCDCPFRGQVSRKAQFVRRGAVAVHARAAAATAALPNDYYWLSYRTPAESVMVGLGWLAAALHTVHFHRSPALGCPTVPVSYCFSPATLAGYLFVEMYSRWKPGRKTAILAATLRLDDQSPYSGYSRQFQYHCVQPCTNLHSDGEWPVGTRVASATHPARWTRCDSPGDQRSERSDWVL